MKKFFLLAAAILLAASLQAQDFTRYLKGEYNAKADSIEYCFVNNFMDKTKGTFWSTPKDADRSSTYIYWQQAHAIDVVVYAYERLKDSNPSKANLYKKYIRSWYTHHANNYHGATFENPYTDDMLWIGLTLTHIGEAMDDNTYWVEARKLYDRYIFPRAIRDSRGLRLPWNWDKNPDGTWKDQNGNACTVGPAALLAARLYQKYEQENYLENAKDFCDYMVRNICKSDGRVEEPPLTYTQGTFGEACRLLYHITGNAQYRTKANLYINYAFTNGRCTHNGLLRHEGESMDQSIFKAVLIPYAVNFVLDVKLPATQRITILQKIQANAEALWKHLDHDQYPKMFCPYYWGDRYDYNSAKSASMGAMTSGASLLENTARMHNELKRMHDEALPILLPAAGRQEDDSPSFRLDGTPASTHSSGIIIRNHKKYLQQ